MTTENTVTRPASRQTTLDRNNWQGCKGVDANNQAEHCTKCMRDIECRHNREYQRLQSAIAGG